MSFRYLIFLSRSNFDLIFDMVMFKEGLALLNQLIPMTREYSWVITSKA